MVGESVAAFDQARAGMADRAASTNPRVVAQNQSGVKTGTHTLLAKMDDLDGGVALPFLKDRKKLTIAGSVLGALVLALIVAAVMKKPAEPAKVESVVAPSNVQPIPPVATAAVPTSGTPDVVKSGAPLLPQTTSTNLVGAAPLTLPSPVSEVGKTPHEAGKTAKAAGSKDGTPDAPKAVAVKPAEQGTLSLRIDPWGEVFVNGRAIGVSPPLKLHKLAPGKYKIEVKNGTFTPYVTNIEVKAKEDVGVKYRFQ